MRSDQGSGDRSRKAELVRKGFLASKGLVPRIYRNLQVVDFVIRIVHQPDNQVVQDLLTSLLTFLGGDALTAVFVRSEHHTPGLIECSRRSVSSGGVLGVRVAGACRPRIC